MRIVIDATFLRTDRISGIERYATELILALLAIDTSNEYHFCLGSENFKRRFPTSVNARFHATHFRNRILTDQVWVPLVSKGIHGDLYHSLAFPPSPFVPRPTVITLHDATFWKHPETRSTGGRYYYSPLFPKAIRRALKVITVSNSSKRDLVEYLDLNPEKIAVVYQGIEARFFEPPREERLIQVRHKYRLPSKFILSVGTIEPRKNLNNLISAFEILMSKGAIGHSLVIVGRKGWQRALNIPQSLKDSIVLTGFVEDGDLPLVYRLSDLFVFPSIYEGFGFPMLEAMASGVPVVASNLSSLPEVGGDSCIYADPFSPTDIADNIEKLVSDKSLRENLTTKGSLRARLFSWQRTAKETIQVYRETIG